MGANSELFIAQQEQEAMENDDFWNEINESERIDYQLDFRSGLTAGNYVFEADTKKFDNGELSAIDLAVKFKEENDILENLISQRKNKLNEIMQSIIEESESFGKDGYKGFRFSSSSREMFDYSTNPKYTELKGQIKDIEDLMKSAYKNSLKGLAAATKDGEEVILPIVSKTTPSLKTDRVK